VRHGAGFRNDVGPAQLVGRPADRVEKFEYAPGDLACATVIAGEWVDNDVSILQLSISDAD